MEKDPDFFALLGYRNSKFKFRKMWTKNEMEKDPDFFALLGYRNSKFKFRKMQTLKPVPKLYAQSQSNLFEGKEETMYAL